MPIDEAHPQQPINPYGASKWMVEGLLQDFFATHGLNSVCLRYFNVCEAITVFGLDYPTEDGTCVRDSIHFEDLCCVHALALDALVQGEKQEALAYNLGNGGAITFSG